MIRVTSFRMVKTTVKSRPSLIWPMTSARDSPSPSRVESLYLRFGSSKTCVATMKVIPCFRQLLSDFAGSHSNSILSP